MNEVGSKNNSKEPFLKKKVASNPYIFSKKTQNKRPTIPTINFRNPDFQLENPPLEKTFDPDMEFNLRIVPD